MSTTDSTTTTLYTVTAVLPGYYVTRDETEVAISVTYDEAVAEYQRLLREQADPNAVGVTSDRTMAEDKIAESIHVADGTELSCHFLDSWQIDLRVATAELVVA